MATEKQIEANRRNALRSTGPRTEAGKAVSRENALTHGLSGAGVVVTEADRVEVDRRIEEWSGELGLDESSSPMKRWRAGRAALESIRVERCERNYLRLCREHAHRAGTCWEEDRLREANELFAKLKKDPARIRPRLESTAQGCEVMIAAWNRLGQIQDDLGAWTEVHRQQALDLLGIPAEYRDGSSPVNPPGAPEANLRGIRRDLAVAEMGRLKGLVTRGLRALDTAARTAAAAAGVGAELTAPVREVLRLEAACHRRLRRALESLDDPAPGKNEPNLTLPDLEPSPIEEPLPASRPSPEPTRPAVAPPRPKVASVPPPRPSLTSDPLLDSDDFEDILSGPPPLDPSFRPYSPSRRDRLALRAIERRA